MFQLFKWIDQANNRIAKSINKRNEYECKYQRKSNWFEWPFSFIGSVWRQACHCSLKIHCHLFIEYIGMNKAISAEYAVTMSVANWTQFVLYVSVIDLLICCRLKNCYIERSIFFVLIEEHINGHRQNAMRSHILWSTKCIVSTSTNVKYGRWLQKIGAHTEHWQLSRGSIDSIPWAVMSGAVPQKFMAPLRCIATHHSMHSAYVDDVYVEISFPCVLIALANLPA